MVTQTDLIPILYLSIPLDNSIILYSSENLNRFQINVKCWNDIFGRWRFRISEVSGSILGLKVQNS